MQYPIKTQFNDCVITCKMLITGVAKGGPRGPDPPGNFNFS